MKEIEQEFLDSGGVWENYRIGDVFVKLSSKFLGDGDKFKAVSKVKTEQYCVPVVYAKSGDNGIMYWAKEGDFETHRNVLSVVYNGAIAAGLVYAQPYDTGILAESYLIKVKEKDVSFDTNLFLKQVLEKVLYPKYSREYLATWTNKVENDQIQLPTQNGKIDFAFMENFIAELKVLRVAELHAYLQATGLSNYTLTEEECKALDEFNQLSEQEFLISDIFSIQSPKKKFNAKDVKFGGLYPYVARGEKNNGIRGYISEDERYLNAGNTISFGQDTATIYYQKEPYFTGDKIKVFSMKEHSLNRYVASYLIARMNKSFSNFSWGNMFNEKVLNSTKIYLPTKNGKIDFEHMEHFIKASEKLVIKDVVDWADREIATTEQVILN